MAGGSGSALCTLARTPASFSLGTQGTRRSWYTGWFTLPGARAAVFRACSLTTGDLREAEGNFPKSVGSKGKEQSKRDRKNEQEKQIICTGNVLCGKHSPDSLVTSISFPSSKGENFGSEKSSDCTCSRSRPGSSRTKILKTDLVSSPMFSLITSRSCCCYCLFVYFWNYPPCHNSKPSYGPRCPIDSRLCSFFWFLKLLF